MVDALLQSEEAASDLGIDVAVVHTNTSIGWDRTDGATRGRAAYLARPGMTFRVGVSSQPLIGVRPRCHRLKASSHSIDRALARGAHSADLNLLETRRRIG